MCFKVKFAANPLKSLVDRPCNRSPRDSHIICNFLVGLTEDELLMDFKYREQKREKERISPQLSAAKTADKLCPYSVPIMCITSICGISFKISSKILNRFHQITADCNYKVAAFAAELVEPHHGICDKFALGVANSQHLLRVKVLNVVNVLGVFHPFAPDAQQAGRCQVLDNIFYK